MTKYILAALTIIGYVIISVLYKKDKLKEKVEKPLKWVLIILFLEATLFNINSYRTDFKDYEVKEINMDSAKITLDTGKNTYDDVYFFPGQKEDFFEINDIGTEIATMRFEFATNGDYNVVVNYTDEVFSDYRHTFSKKIDDKYERSKYIPCFLSGKTEKLKLHFTTYTYLDFNKSKIIINEPIPFEFNFLRVGILLGFGLFLYFCKYSKKMNSPGMQEYFLFKTCIVFGIAVLFSLMNLWFSEKTDEEATNVYTNNFINALMNKQVSLLEEPLDRLQEKENPYDPTERSDITRSVDGKKSDTRYLWDTVYYEGKYYIYFGILPALELLLPYKMITGEYMLSATAVLIYSIATILGLVFLSLEILEKWFKEIPFKLWVYFIIFVLFGSMVLWTNSRASFYEIVVIAAMAHSILGAAMIFSAFRNKNKISYFQLFIGCTLLALSVACRPTFLLVSIILLPYLINLFVRKVKEKNVKEVVKLILSAGIPYITVGIGLMYYNYIRFGNVLEFGTTYQLTIADMGKLKYRWLVIPIGLQTLLFKIPLIIEHFPFFSYNSRALTFYGFYYTESLICGYLFIAPITALLFGIKKILKNAEQKDMKIFLYISLCIALFMACFSVYMAGSLQRYVMDYAWILCIVASCLMLQIYENIKTNENKEIYVKGVQALLIISIIVGIFICGIIGENSYLQAFSVTDYLKLKYMVCFWE